MKRFLCCASLLLFAATSFAADLPLPELFKRAKDEFAAGRYKESLADFELLDANSARPGFENDRAKLIPVVTFYRGANLAALGRKDDAKAAFAMYLGFSPNASITSPPYPKATVDLFEQARKESSGHVTTIAAAYATFIPPAGWVLEPDEHWIESPVRYLLTPAQKKEYATFTTNGERATFIEAFWKQLDPTPGTEANEFRKEIERRISFADVNFATEKQPGRYGDRALIFTFLGAPTYAAMGNIGTGEDATAALRARGNGDMGRAAKSSNSSSATGMAAISGQQPEDNLEQPYNRGTRESWIYRGERLPKGIAFHEVPFNFVTKKGYGTGVLQKDSEPMQTLGMAVEIARRDKKLN